MKKYNIPFSPPDLTEKEIESVIEVLKSGWITSGPKVFEFENKVAEYCECEKAVAVSSATSALDLIMRVLNFNAPDEIITTPYTYASTSNTICHRGIKPIFVDLEKDSFLIDINKIKDAITAKTKAIVTVDIAGIPLDYDAIRNLLKELHREDIALISDSSHAFGATYKGKKVGCQADFHVFSFHAVKNLTTAEGGAITFNDNNFNGKEDLYKEFKYTALNGQTKDALTKSKAGGWQYDILTDGLKCNMTDIHASIGLVQLTRYKDMLKRRAELTEIYTDALKDKAWAIIPFTKDSEKETSYHLYPLRIQDFTEAERNEVINLLAEIGIPTNVHFTPLPMFTYYKSLGYSIDDYPNCYNQYKNELTLPLYSSLSDEDAKSVVTEVIAAIEKVKEK
ncbi:DegT/DnrJ/EryC1/StrS family aminotransferase [Clostridium felsineum]|uniref:UDP-4-amino-4-deoxy-L-arabinose--oxoglutarate aminotransferase n=1 Tax=Clostridium felsineum TaxID=36839 RepID=A0A1S8L799_9CLOT|nr:DegT/DnrJ/EryC1/StrS aminotransferase family protein [Clostridium felsineum]URZ00238.1 UDP-4-amino-4-deoxy-L-arabinose--oxoglutarate aminotransferase [Clostridium felsineum]URZ07126.1 UDP-4-amino-4-deoxy-L-arabinose--oxoglutarate aminotransferase [Clostridium felsineum]URZ12156.1 UDP-4-amino-4-deoxy-L-arabinose--oxoglutarate aminotransferase [Clostridium felsineum]